MMACNMSYAWLARKAAWSAPRAAAIRRSSSARAPSGRVVPARPASPRAGPPIGNASAASPIAVQVDRRARAARVHPASSSATVAGATRLRRRLSKIFQRAMSGSRLRRQPSSVGHDRQQPPEDLPVAAHPPVLPLRVGEHARRVVVDDFDVGDERRPRVEALRRGRATSSVFSGTRSRSARTKASTSYSPLPVKMPSPKDPDTRRTRRSCRDRRRCGPRRRRAKIDPAALAIVTLTRGCRIA